jgi:hypothetical protein
MIRVKGGKKLISKNRKKKLGLECGPIVGWGKKIGG